MKRMMKMMALLRFGAALALWLAVAGCTTVEIGAAGKIEPQATWALLPFENHTETPQAGLRAEAIAGTLLRARGVNLRDYPPGLSTETLLEPSDRKLMEQALAWAKAQGLRYALVGEVNEWRYKVGIDGEPAVGVTLQVLDLGDGKIVYSAGGGKSGWSREALSAVAQKLIKQLVNGIPLQ
jgi:hypothetical protein